MIVHWLGFLEKEFKPLDINMGETVTITILLKKIEGSIPNLFYNNKQQNISI